MARDATRHRVRRKVGGLTQLPWRRLANPYKPLEILSADQVEAIHDASMRVLETLGVEFLSETALNHLARAGASVDRSNSRVRFDRALVLDAVAKAPATFTLYARNPERHVTLGGTNLVFGAVAGPPNCSDLDRGRRPGSYRDFCDLLKLIQSLNVIHVAGGAPVAPLDLPPETRHLDQYYGYLTLTDRVFHSWGLGALRVEDGIDMLCLARGIDRGQLAREPALITNINSNSPLRYDEAMIDGMLAMAAAGQAVIVTPFTLAGAMSPVTLAGSLVQQNAEALAGIALIQIAHPGTPVIYGGFTSNVDMRSGAPAFGTPEYTKAALATGQLARRYRLPYRSSNVNAANCVDAQAAYESEMAVWGAAMGHVNYLYQAAGWLEGGLVASFEKMIVDAEMLQMMGEFMQPIPTGEAEFGIAAMADVGPGGHFFGTAHTLERYETAFYAPMLSDWRNYETWRLAGAEDAAQRANRIWKELLAAYEPPALDPAVDEALRAFMDRRKREIAQAAA